MLFEDICSFCENEIDQLTELDMEGNLFCTKCQEEVEYHINGEHESDISDFCPSCN